MSRMWAVVRIIMGQDVSEGIGFCTAAGSSTVDVEAEDSLFAGFFREGKTLYFCRNPDTISSLVKIYPSLQSGVGFAAAKQSCGMGPLVEQRD